MKLRDAIRIDRPPEAVWPFVDPRLNWFVRAPVALVHRIGSPAGGSYLDNLKQLAEDGGLTGGQGGNDD